MQHLGGLVEHGETDGQVEHARAGVERGDPRGERVVARETREGLLDGLDPLAVGKRPRALHPRQEQPAVGCLGVALLLALQAGAQPRQVALHVAGLALGVRLPRLARAAREHERPLERARAGGGRVEQEVVRPGAESLLG